MRVPDGRWIWRAAAFLACAIAIVLRAPNLLITPRFWAEEGSVFFRFAYIHSWLDALTYVDTRAGYLTLVANVGGLMADRLVPLEHAPWVTTLLAFAIQLVPFALVLFGRIPMFAHPLRKLAACAILLFAPSHNTEVWLNTINCPVYLGLIALLLLLQDPESHSRLARWATRGVLLFCGLSGIYADALWPAFALRAYTTRTRERWIQAGILFATLALQIVIAFHSMAGGALNEKRVSGLGLHTLSDAGLFLIGEPLLGHSETFALTDRIDPWGGLVYVGVLLIGAVLILRARRRVVPTLEDPATLLLIGFVSLAAATSAMSVGAVPGARYAVLSGFVLLLFVLESIRPGQPHWWNAFAISLLALSLSIGAWKYRDSPRMSCDGRDWRHEVELWRASRKHKLAICPEGWDIRLPRGTLH